MRTEGLTVEQVMGWDAAKRARLAENAECMELALVVLNAPAGRFADRGGLAKRILQRGLEFREVGTPWL